MPYSKIVCMGFTCILYTNIILDGHYWDFNESLKADTYVIYCCTLELLYILTYKHDIKHSNSLCRISKHFPLFSTMKLTSVFHFLAILVMCSVRSYFEINNYLKLKYVFFPTT